MRKHRTAAVYIPNAVRGVSICHTVHNIVPPTHLAAEAGRKCKRPPCSLCISERRAAHGCGGGKLSHVQRRLLILRRPPQQLLQDQRALILQAKTIRTTDGATLLSA